MALWCLVASSPSRGESAREAYNRGLSLYAAGSFGEAAEAFLAAYQKKPKPLILFNVGQALRKKGDFDQALVYYKRFLDEASPDERAPLADETRKYVKEIEAEQALKKSLVDNADRQEAGDLRFEHKPPPPPPSDHAPPPSLPPPSAPAPPPATAPAPTSAPAPTTAPASTTAPAATTTTPALTSTAEAPPPKRPIYQRWWLWTAVGVVAVAVAVGVGVGVGARPHDPDTALGTREPMF